MRCYRDACFPGYRVSRTHIPRDTCFPAHISLMDLCSTSHSDICFPGYFVSPLPLRIFTTYVVSYICMHMISYSYSYLITRTHQPIVIGQISLDSLVRIQEFSEILLIFLNFEINKTDISYI